MSHPPYPSPPYAPEQMDSHTFKSLLASSWQVLDQPPPPTLREILSAYKSKGDGDRDMLLAMLNAKSAEDQRIAAMATLHQKLLDARATPRPPPSHEHPRPLSGPAAYEASSSSSGFAHSPRLPKISPLSSPRDVTLPSIHPPPSPRKRARTSQSPPPMRRRYSGQGHPAPHTFAPSEQLPPSPPSSSPGRTMLCAELHPRGAMAIGSLLSSTSHQHDRDSDSEWPSRTSAERTGSAAVERESYRRHAQVSG